jgi:hypothetical protein
MTFGAMIEGDMADVVDDLGTVSVQQCDPVTGAALATAANVTVMKKGSARIESPVGPGAVAAETVRWHLRASQIPWIPKKRDMIVDSDGVRWEIGGVNTATLGTRYICETTRVRG